MGVQGCRGEFLDRARPRGNEVRHPRKLRDAGADGYRDGAARTYRAHGAGHPAGRAAQPEEIARAILFLLSPEQAYVTGAEILVSGGR